MKVSRIDVIGQNGNDGQHYDEEDNLLSTRIPVLIYENENYTVVFNPVVPEEKQYEVINKATGAVEAASQYLPKALSNAEEFHLYLKNKIHTKMEREHPIFGNIFISDEEEDEEEVSDVPRSSH
mgnify:CR=1 FL=1